jgi:hypothetical protein
MRKEVWVAFHRMSSEQRKNAWYDIHSLFETYCFIPFEVLLESLREAAQLPPAARGPSGWKWRILVSLSGIRCVRAGLAIGESRGTQAWRKFCNEKSPIVGEVFVGGIDGFGDASTEMLVRRLFAGDLKLPASGGGSVPLVPLDWSMSMLRNGGCLVVSEPKPGMVNHLIDDILLQGRLGNAAVAKRQARAALWFSSTHV